MKFNLLNKTNDLTTNHAGAAAYAMSPVHTRPAPSRIRRTEL